MPITMPGMSTSFDIKGMIKKLVDAKKEPLKKIDREIDDLNLKKEIWVSLRKKLADLQDLSKRLYDYRSPFLEMKADSSDKDVLTAMAVRGADKGIHHLDVLQIAKAYRISSDSIDKEKNLKPSVFYFEFNLNDKKKGSSSKKKKKIKLDFRDRGSIKTLAKLFKDKCGKYLIVRTINDSTDTSVLMLEAKQEGVNSGFKFSGDLKTLLEIGLLTKGGASKSKLDFSGVNFQGYRDKLGKYGKEFVINNGSLELNSFNGAEFSLPDKLNTGEKIIITGEVKFVASPKNRDSSKNKKDKNLQDNFNVNIEVIDPVQVGDIKIFGANLIPNEFSLSDSDTNSSSVDKSRNIQSTNKNISNSQDGKGEISFLEIAGLGKNEFSHQVEVKKGGWEKVSINLDKIAGLKVASSLIFKNSGQGKLFFRNFTINKDGKDAIVAKNLLQKGQDAFVKIDKLKIRKSSNNIDDLIDKVTLTLIKPGKNIKLAIDHDYEMINKYIYEFIMRYNEIIVYINAITVRLKPDEAKKLKKKRENMSELVKALEDKNSSEIDKHKGKMVGDMSMGRLKARIRMIMMNPYPTKLGKELALLMQIGISTGKIGAKWEDLNKQKGALELDTDILKKFIKKDVIAVKELFGSDNNQDNIADKGVSLELAKYLKYYTQAGNSGIIAVKLKVVERLIKDKEKQKTRAEDSIAKYEDRIRRQFMNMEIQMNKYKKQGDWLKRNTR